MSVAVVTFPGSNCDRDCVVAVRDAVGAPVARAWHKDAALPAGTSAVILPGGFSYGDYLRCGAMAAHAPIMAAVKRFADVGGAVLGICNGFQILCEAQMLPGALLQNSAGRFVCQDAGLVVDGDAPLLSGYAPSAHITLPVAHGEGNYFADDDTLDALEKDRRIAFRYATVDAKGKALVNGAARGIAGVNGGAKRNIIGLMPHPERRSADILGGVDGLPLLRALAHAGGAA